MHLDLRDARARSRMSPRPRPASTVTRSATSSPTTSSLARRSARACGPAACEDLVPASHTTYAPFVKKVEYQCMDVDDDGFLSVMDSDGNTRDDLKIPDAMPMPPPDADVLSKRIRDLLAEEKDFYIVVLMACGIEQVIDTKVMTN
eukprot:scaffold321789_cov30-Tisochrysis_lutea.AAC.2